MSRAPSRGRGANPAARPAARGVYVQSPQSDIYVALLGVALGAMILGCILLVLVLNRYEFKTKVSRTTAPAAAHRAAAERISEILYTVRL